MNTCPESVSPAESVTTYGLNNPAKLCAECGLRRKQRRLCERCHSRKYNAAHPDRHKAYNRACRCGASITKRAAACAACASATPKLPRPRCACGGPASQSSARCLFCRAGRPPTCAHCGVVFYTGRRSARTCSPACAKARQETVAAGRKRAGYKSVATRARVQRRRDRLRAIGGVVEPGRWLRISERDGWVCWICSGPIDPALRSPHRSSGTADHVVAIVDGGSDHDDNLRAAHFGCNSGRPHGGPKGGGWYQRKELR